jgi:hypothetical protein
VGKSLTDQLTSTIRAATAQFGKLAAEQKVITAESRYLDFGSARPATVPSGTTGSTSDVTICDNATALVQTAAQHEQVFLGTLVRIGETWKLVGLPAIGTDNQPQTASVFIQPSGPAGTETVAAAGPTAEMQKLLDELQRLDGEADQLSGDALARNIEERANRLEKLAESSTDKKLSEQFYNQLTDMLGVAIQMKTYPQGEARMSDLEKKLVDLGVDEQVTSHVAFQRMWAQYIVSQEKPDANQARIQEQWLTDLQAFVEKYPKSNDAAEALLQLGINQEFVGNTEEAAKWYQQLVRDFPNTAPGKKARGAMRRFNSVGTAMRLAGKDLRGSNVDISAAPYRGKVVLIQYWATWSENCKNDMVLLKNLYAQNGGGRDFEILGVCLDSTAVPAQQFLAQNRFPWNHVYEPGGVDGRLADDMGVMTLPLMLLVDRDGRVVKNNIQVAELATELARLQKSPGEQANALRRGTTPR